MDIVLKFADGLFKLFAAEYGKWAKDRIILFRVRIDQKPFECALRNGIKLFDRLTDVTSNDSYVDLYTAHHNLTVEKLNCPRWRINYNNKNKEKYFHAENHYAHG